MLIKLALARAIGRALACLPLGLLRALGDVLGVLYWLGSASARAVVQANTAQAGLQAHSLTVLRHSARAALEMAWVWFSPQAVVAARCTVSAADAAQIQTALAGTHPTVLLTPHLGCFEALAKWIATQTPLTAMYRRPESEWVGQLIEQARIAQNLNMVPADETGVRALLKALKAGGTVGILPDQVPRKGEGAWLGWFGKPAYTITLPAKLQARTQAALFVVAALPCAGGWMIVCEPIAHVQGDSVEASAQINAALERLIRRAPLHYAWTYRRYKTPLGVPPPSESA